MDELHRQNISTNIKLDVIASKFSQLDSIEHKLTKLDKTVSDLGLRVEKVEAKHVEFEKSVEFLSTKFKAETEKFSNVASNVRVQMGKSV